MNATARAFKYFPPFFFVRIERCVTCSSVEIPAEICSVQDSHTDKKIGKKTVEIRKKTFFLLLSISNEIKIKWNKLPVDSVTEHDFYARMSRWVYYSPEQRRRKRSVDKSGIWFEIFVAFKLELNGDEWNWNPIIYAHTYNVYEYRSVISVVGSQATPSRYFRQNQKEWRFCFIILFDCSW